MMAPGALAQIKFEWRYCYRAHGSPMAGVVQAISPSGGVARIRFDRIADSYILVDHLEPVEVDVSLEREALALA